MTAVNDADDIRSDAQKHSTDCTLQYSLCRVTQRHDSGSRMMMYSGFRVPI